jgi:hypothetical protein
MLGIYENFHACVNSYQLVHITLCHGTVRTGGDTNVGNRSVLIDVEMSS